MKTARPIAERFWEHVERADGDGCWEWTAGLSEKGYGRMSGTGGKVHFVHRVSYELHIGPIPTGLFVCHRCDNPRCVRPDHLFLGTASDNYHDAIRKGRADVSGLRNVFGLLRDRLTAEQVNEIRAQFQAGASITGLAAQHRIGWHTARDIVHRKNPSHA